MPFKISLMSSEIENISPLKIRARCYEKGAQYKWPQKNMKN